MTIFDKISDARARAMDQYDGDASVTYGRVKNVLIDRPAQASEEVAEDFPGLGQTTAYSPEYAQAVQQEIRTGQYRIGHQAGFEEGYKAAQADISYEDRQDRHNALEFALAVHRIAGGPVKGDDVLSDAEKLLRFLKGEAEAQASR